MYGCVIFVRPDTGVPGFFYYDILFLIQSPYMTGDTERVNHTIGIDEVGRGPIAGPVAVGAFMFVPKLGTVGLARAKQLFRGVKESKQLSETAREEWYTRILEAQRASIVDFRVTFRSEKIIDDPKRGLAYAIRAALAASLDGLAKTHGFAGSGAIAKSRVRVLLDGGLKAPVEYTNQKTIIKGDEKEMVIALASICAKVLRDRRMRTLARKHPQYSFDIHKGYGTRAHYAAIKKYGTISSHRKSFLAVR